MGGGWRGAARLRPVSGLDVKAQQRPEKRGRDDVLARTRSDRPPPPTAGSGPSVTVPTSTRTALDEKPNIHALPVEDDEVVRRRRRDAAPHTTEADHVRTKHHNPGAALVHRRRYRACADSAMPALEGIDGCVGLSLLVDRTSGRCIVISSWESEEAMRASEEAVRPIRDRAAELLGGSRQVEEWKIAAMHREHRASEGACVRATWVRSIRIRSTEASNSKGDYPARPRGAGRLLQCQPARRPGVRPWRFRDDHGQRRSDGAEQGPAGQNPSHRQPGSTRRGAR